MPKVFLENGRVYKSVYQSAQNFDVERESMPKSLKPSLGNFEYAREKDSMSEFLSVC